ncbi:palmitoyltransferase ZDHHC6-like isoform X2 [Lampetra planeri]
MAGGVPWRRLCHWGPWLVLSGLVLCGLVTLFATLLWAWPVHRSGDGGGGAIVHLAFLLLWVPTLLTPYLHAVFAGAGFVSVGWRPERSEEARLLPYCEKCQSFKPLRSHHCRQCQRCVLKMDHHCPWINACVGLRNRASFVAFLLLTPTAGLHSLCLLGSTLYQEFLAPVFLVPAAGGSNSTLAVEAAARYPFGVPAFLATLISFVVTLTAIPFMVLLGVNQLNGLLRNRTFIEAKIEAKAAERFAGGRRDRLLRFPFDLGSAWRNLRQELPPTRLRMDGLRWPTAAGADPYCVNEEHAAQKEERTLSYTLDVWGKNKSRRKSGRAGAPARLVPRAMRGPARRGALGKLQRRRGDGAPRLGRRGRVGLGPRWLRPLLPGGQSRRSVPPAALRAPTGVHRRFCAPQKNHLTILTACHTYWILPW